MFGSIVAGAIGAAGGILGKIQANKQMKQVEANIRRDKADNQAWYDRRINEDATQRADAQEMISRMEESVKNRNRQAAGTQAVMGGTEESLAATKQANNQAVAQTAAAINASASSRKDTIEQTYQANNRAYNQQLNDLKAGQANASNIGSQQFLQTGFNLAQDLYNG